MSQALKWTLLGVSLAALIVLILSLPIFGVIDYDQISGAVNAFVSFMAPYVKFGRSAVNMLLFPWARTILSGMLVWIIIKPLAVQGLAVVLTAYHKITKH